MKVIMVIEIKDLLKHLLLNLFQNIKIKYQNLKIMILCFPRILGYVFDPLSIIYCFDNNKLISILYEVKKYYK